MVLNSALKFFVSLLGVEIMPKRTFSEITEEYYEEVNEVKHDARIRCAVRFVHFFSKLWPVLNNIRDSFKLYRCDDCAEKCEHLSGATSVMYFKLNSIETAFGIGFMDDVEPSYELFMNIIADKSVIDRITTSPFFKNYRGSSTDDSCVTLRFAFDTDDRKLVDKIHRLK